MNTDAKYSRSVAIPKVITIKNNQSIQRSITFNFIYNGSF